MGVSTSGRRLTAEADTLAGLIMYGWELRNYQVIRTPALLALGDTFYDVTASAEGNVVPTKSEFREMLRTLLAERFQLRVHTEKREMPVYALVPAKNGPKLTEAAPDAAGTSRLMVNGRNYGVTNPKAAMADILRAIENSFPDRPVIDRTGLTATYEIKLTYTPDIPSNRKEPDLGDISIFTALQEQLACGWNRRKLWSTCW